MENATIFGLQAQVYSSARPTYPNELFEWIADHAPARELAWDVGCGSGQAAHKLVEQFSHVHASDIDAAQLDQAATHSNIDFVAAPAHKSSLADESVDAICVATALHWFDHAQFWPEVRRVARDGAVFCAWTYHAAETHSDVETVLLAPINKILEPYWSEGNRLSWRGYSSDELGMPFSVLPTPTFACELQWRPQQIAAFVRSWSAHQKARMDGHGEALDEIESEALSVLEDKPWSFNLPLNCLAARIG
ncbi:MAG: class I SAM-dependent methyltransferase [Albidovulum sp.]